MNLSIPRPLRLIERKAVAPDQALGEDPTLELVSRVKLGRLLVECDGLRSSPQIHPVFIGVGLNFDRDSCKVTGDRTNSTTYGREPQARGG